MIRFLGVAFRNVFRNGKRSFTLGINYTIVTFILVLLFAFSRGATSNITSSLARSTAGHITISGQFATGGKIFNGLKRKDEITSIIKKTLGANTSVIARYQLQSTVYYKGISKRIGFLGIDPVDDAALAGQMVFSEGGWDAWAQDDNGLALPAELAEYFGLSLGDEVVVSTRTRFGAFNTGILKVRGLWTTDNFFMRGQAIVHFPFLRGLDLASSDAASTMFIYLPEPKNLSARRDTLSEALAAAGFEVTKPKTDAEAISAISAASTKYEADTIGRDRVMLKLATLDEVLGIVRSVLGAVNALGGLVAAVMLFVIAVSIFINLRMSVNERLKEIGTMRALGFQAGGITGIFMAESVSLALVFSTAGALLGAAVALAVAGFVSLPPGGNLGIFLNAGHLSLIPLPLDMLAIILIIGLFAALFSYFPARRGGLIRPVEALTSTF